jgi:hypothetical protein
LGIDLRSYWGAVYPSQWTFTTGPKRELIDETTIPLGTLAASDSQALVQAFQGGELTPLAVGATLQVFTRFNGRCPDVTPSPELQYLILPIVGALRSTDGHRVAELRVTEQAPDTRDVVIRLPLAPHLLPSDVTVLSPAGAE